MWIVTDKGISPQPEGTRTAWPAAFPLAVGIGVGWFLRYGWDTWLARPAGFGGEVLIIPVMAGIFWLGWTAGRDGCRA